MTAKKAPEGLLNYSTKVPASQTMAEVQRIIARMGASRVMAEYDDDGEPTALAFQVPTPVGPRAFTLPVNADKVLVVMQRDKATGKVRSHISIDLEQAKRVAWRILKDWVEAQAAIIRTEMVTLDQIMLPYMEVEAPAGPRSLYEAIIDQGITGALPGGQR